MREVRGILANPEYVASEDYYLEQWKEHLQSREISCASLLSAYVYRCRYCLDWNDQGDESEEEIFAELSSGEEEMEEEEDEEGFGGAETGEDKGE